MSFELDIAAKRDPLDGRKTGDRMSTAGPYTALTLNGIFDERASQRILRAVTDIFDMGADSVLIDMEDVSAHDDACLQNFAAALMSLRGSGRHVQVVARQSAFHAALAQAPDSRDWLRNFADGNVGEARLAIHLDGPAV
jgi:anti-anti-sigma regulatory factor